MRQREREEEKVREKVHFYVHECIRRSTVKPEVTALIYSIMTLTRLQQGYPLEKDNLLKYN